MVGSSYPVAVVSQRVFPRPITKTRLYNFDPLKPHFYTLKQGFTGVDISFLISAKTWIVGTR